MMGEKAGLPTEAAARPGVPAPAEGEAAPRPRILVVDDVFENRDILTRRLVRRGFDVVEAAGGVEALAKLEAEPFDLVLLDIMMPDMCGNEVLRTIRKTRSTVELPVVMVSAKSQSEDVVESLDIGASDYVTKPVDFAVALARINAQLTRKRVAEAEMRAKRDAERRAAELDLRVGRVEEEAGQRREEEDRLHFLAYHDGLTGLLNRTAFRERLSAALHDPAAAALDPALLFVDLDRFKSINDVYGHEVGDRLLGEVAARLRTIAGQLAAVARLGGDEFGIFLPAPAGPEEPAALAERVVAGLCEPFVVDGQQFQIGASCGVASASICAGSLDTLVKAADLAMYRAKSGGRNRSVKYDPSMLEEIKARSRLEVDLRRAIHENALEVVYQPIVDVRSGKVTGCEALARWPHPQRGLMMPGDFVPVAEETGLIVPLGAFVLRSACAEAAGWPEEVRVAVNLSPLQFRSRALLETIEGALDASGLDPRRLELEITESALLDAGEDNLQILRRIRGLGIRTCIDDFGTGYSSLSYIRTFDFDKIKIDRLFVSGLHQERKGAAIIRAIAELGAGIGVSLSAEGVETSEELAAVAAYGCREYQGLLFSAPLRPEEARALIDAQQAMAPRAAAG